ncbi:hypothetical protein D3C87_1688700 [compost metagenome]
MIETGGRRGQAAVAGGDEGDGDAQDGQCGDHKQEGRHRLAQCSADRQPKEAVRSGRGGDQLFGLEEGEAGKSLMREDRSRLYANDEAGADNAGDDLGDEPGAAGSGEAKQQTGDCHGKGYGQGRQGGQHQKSG